MPRRLVPPLRLPFRLKVSRFGRDTRRRVNGWLGALGGPNHRAPPARGASRIAEERHPMPLTDYARDKFVAPEMSQFSSPVIPNRSKEKAECRHCIENFVLNSMLRV